MDIRVLTYFESLARLKHLSRASEELHISEPPLSIQIRNLENEIGICLFHRTRTGMILTPEGQEFLNKVRPVLNNYHELSSYAMSLSQGTNRTVRLFIVPSAMDLVAQVINRAAEQEKHILFDIKTAFLPYIEAAVENREANLAISRLPVLSADISFHILTNDTIRVVLKNTDPLARRSVLYPSDLMDRTLAFIRNPMNVVGFNEVMTRFEEAGVEPQTTAFVDCTPMLIKLVEYGAVIGFCPSSSLVYGTETITTIPFTDSDINSPLAVIWSKFEANPYVTLVRDLFIEMCHP